MMRVQVEIFDRHTKQLLDTRVFEAEYLDNPFVCTFEEEDDRRWKFMWDEELRIEKELDKEFGNDVERLTYGYKWL